MKVRIFYFLAAAALLSTLALLTTVANSAQSSLAYDEVTRIILGQSAPEPGSFAADFQAAVDAQKSVASGGTHGGLFGGILNAVDAAKGAMNLLKTGAASSEYFLAGWQRTDDLGAQTATINKPAQHQIIYLDLSKKTYRVVDTNLQLGSAPPAPLERARNPSGRPSQPGTGKLDVTVSSTSLGPKLIENVPTNGYRTTFSMVESRSTGSCVDGTFGSSLTEYVSRYAEPRVATPRAAARPTPRSHPELMALRPGCTPVISMHASGGAQAPSDRLAMWMLITINGGAPSAQGQMSGGFSTLVERGNVRSLGPTDKGLFGIPAGFTREQ